MGRWEPSRQGSLGLRTRDRGPGSAIHTGIGYLDLRQPLECHVPSWTLCCKRDIDLGIVIAAAVTGPCAVVHVVWARLGTRVSHV